MKSLLLVGLGGFFGAACRHGLSSWVTRAFKEPGFPVGILVVNLLGCLLIGLAFGLADARDLFTRELRLLLFAGFLGGFTTFSTFGYDTLILMRGGHLGFAAINVLVSVIAGVFLVWAGYQAMLKLGGGP